MISEELIFHNRENIYQPRAWISSMKTVKMHAGKQRKPLNFWKLAVAPQQGEIADCANELMRQYAQYIPGSEACSNLLLSLVQECRERIRNTLLPSAERDLCNIEFVPNMCRGLEIALSRITGLSRIILSPFEHPSAVAVAHWLARLIKAEVCQLHFEAADYLLPRSEQENKLVNMIQDKQKEHDGTTALILSVVSYATGQAIRTGEIMSRLQAGEASTLHIILDGAHAAGNHITEPAIQKCWAYVISVHKWLLSPEPCGIVIMPRSVSEEEVSYDAWCHTFPATTTNVRIFASLVSSLRAVDRVGLENWQAHSIALRDHFMQRMQAQLSVIGDSSGEDLTSFVAVRPSPGYRWRWRSKELTKFLEMHAVYVLMLSIDPQTAWMRIAFPYTVNIQQVDELCDILDTSLEFIGTEHSMARAARAQVFWQENLQQLSETFVFHTKEQHQARQERTLQKVEISIAAKTCNALAKAVQKSGINLEALLVTAHFKAVSLYSGQAMITTGIGTENAPQVLPYALSLGEKETWQELALRVQEVLELLPELESGSLVDLYNTRKLYNVSFAYLDHTGTSCWPERKDETSIPADNADGIVLHVKVISKSNKNGANDLQCQLEFRGDLITKEQILAFGGCYCHILAAVGGDLTNVHTGSLWLSDEDERQLAKWNNTICEFPMRNNLAQLFEEQAHKTPDRIASINKNEQLTYRQLNERSNQLARYLRKLGVRPEVLVGICMKRSNLMLIGLLGILKAGGGYVPLDPKYPSARLGFMLEDAKVDLILTDSIISETLSFEGRQMIRLDDEWNKITTFAKENLKCQTTADHVAYVVYTSGSTGFPKAAEIEHRSVIELMYWARAEFGLDTISGVLASSSICFDMSIFELYVPLSFGGTVILADDILQLWNMQANTEVSLLSTVPSALCTLAELGWVPDNTRAVLLAGEPLTNQMTERIFNATKLEKIWNAYGLSEDTTYTTTALIKRGSTEAVTIGRPIANRQLYVLDEYQQRVPIGVIGELYVAGNGLARGYINRPELTAERFLPNRFDSNPDARMYRTGDLVRYRPDGKLEYIGRKDYQIKLRGHRIDLGEIEMTLAAHEAVQQCVAVCREDGGEKRLVAYVVIKNNDSNVSALQLKEHLKTKLPEWMVPAAIVCLEKLPTTAHGKLDRQALPAPEYCS